MTTSIAASTIAGQAFRLMELSPISSFADDSTEAQAAAEQYPVALQMCLEASDWSFASVTCALPEIVPPAGAYVDPERPHAFTLPADICVMREVGDDFTLWQVERGRLLRASDPGPIRIRYTAQITDETQLPATFRTVVTYQLAILLAPVFLGTQSKRQLLEQDLQNGMLQCRRMFTREASEASWSGEDLPDDWVSTALSRGCLWPGAGR